VDAPRRFRVLASLVAVSAVALAFVGLEQADAPASRSASAIDQHGADDQPVREEIPDLDDALTAVDTESARDTAIATDLPVEDLSQRSAATSWYALPSGNWVASLSSGERYVENPDAMGVEDAWVPIDVSLAPVDNQWLAPVAASGTLRVAAGGGAHEALLSYTPEGTSTTLSVLWADTLPVGEVDGARVFYRDISPGVDLMVESLQEGFELFYVVHDQTALDAMGSFPIRYSVDSGSIAEEEGAYYLKDDAGETLGSLPSPYVWDAASDARSSTPVLAAWSPVPVIPASVELEDANAVGAEDIPAGNEADLDVDYRAADNQLTLEMRVPEAFVSDPATQFPLIIDPSLTTTIGTPYFDTYVNGAYPASKYSTRTYLITGSYNNGGEYGQSYLSFDFAPVLGKDVLGGEIELWEYWSSSCNKTTWYVYAARGGNSNTNYYNRPSRIGGVFQGYSTDARRPSCSGGEGWVDAQMDSHTRSITTATSAAHHAFEVYASPKSYYTWKRFYSNNASSKRPRYNVLINRPPNTPTEIKLNGTSAVNGSTITLDDPTLELTAKVSDPDAQDVALAVTVERGDADGSEVVFERRLSGYESSGSTITMDLSPFVAYGETYTITVATWDKRLYSASSAGPYSFSLVAPPPVDYPTADDTKLGDSNA
jgi:hypothetical protein